MALPRSMVVAAGEIGAYHCIARCVRRAFLCGADPVTGRSFDHRKGWVRQRLELLAGAFAVDVGGYAVMSNHLHVVLKARPDVCRTWSAEEVTRRWRMVFPVKSDKPEAGASRFDAECADEKLVATRRERLANVSWFMRCLCEPIARQANREDRCKGRFWEGRFKCVALLDDAAILACTAYVDLNPVRAGLAKTPESAPFTSVHDRVHQRRYQHADAKAKDGWLAPIATKASRTKPSRRASQTPWLDMTQDDYLRLLDWTGRQLRADKRGAIPADVAPILERLRIRPSGWLGCVAEFGTRFKRAAGSPAQLEAHAERNHQRWLHGATHCHAAFV